MERRKTPRTSIPRLAYVNFEPYNTGGVITDLSTAGLRFHTVAPVQQGGLLRLSLILGATPPIEAVGELVWTDATRETGGVRFAVLPPAAADQIKNWLDNLATPNGGEAGATPETVVSEPNTSLPSGSAAEREMTSASESGAVPSKREAPKPIVQTQNAPPKSIAPQNAPLPAPVAGQNTRPPWVPPSARPSAAASPAGAPSSDAPAGAGLAPYGWVLPGQPSTMPWITHFDPDPPARSAFARGLIGGVIVCLMLAPLAWLGLRRYVWHNGSISLANPAVSSPISASPAPAEPNAGLPAPDVPNAAGANSGAANPLDSKSVTAGNPAARPEQVPSAQGPPAQGPSAAAIPNPTANPQAGSVTQSAPTSADAKPAPKPPEQPPIAQGAIKETAPRDIAPPDSLALASQHVAKTPPAAAPQPADDGETQLILAWQYLEGQGGRPRDPAAASQLLWSAVQKGNLTAETTLANLYLRGEGVPKNCAQARVLLSAASDKGDPQARQKLSDLNKTGCR